jgi:hypothetical protein
MFSNKNAEYCEKYSAINIAHGIVSNFYLWNLGIHRISAIVLLAKRGPDDKELGTTQN